MQIETLDGLFLEWHPKQTKNNISKLQQCAINVIEELLPGTPIVLETFIPVSKKKKLRLDIYLPRFKLAAEIQGKQHQELTKFFQTKKQFAIQAYNDNLKKEWCLLNNIKIIYLYHNESEQQWKKTISQNY